MTLQELELLVPSRVLARRKDRSRLRLVIPQTLNFCELCGAGDLKKTLKWEGVSNQTLLVLCLKCGLEEINSAIQK